MFGLSRPNGLGSGLVSITEIPDGRHGRGTRRSTRRCGSPYSDYRIMLSKPRFSVRKACPSRLMWRCRWQVNRDDVDIAIVENAIDDEPLVILQEPDGHPVGHPLVFESSEVVDSGVQQEAVYDCEGSNICCWAKRGQRSLSLLAERQHVAAPTIVSLSGLPSRRRCMSRIHPARFGGSPPPLWLQNQGHDEVALVGPWSRHSTRPRSSPVLRRWV